MNRAREKDFLRKGSRFWRRFPHNGDDGYETYQVFICAIRWGGPTRRRSFRKVPILDPSNDDIWIGLRPDADRMVNLITKDCEFYLTAVLTAVRMALGHDPPSHPMARYTVVSRSNNIYAPSREFVIEIVQSVL